MARADAYERMLRSMWAFVRLVGRSSEGAHVIELDGVLGCVCPAVPERSLPNSVVYESQQALIAALPELARHYDEAGVDAWTVWTPEDDSGAIAALGEAGHKLDAEPAAMTLDLSQLGEPPEIDYRTGDDLVPIVADINDRSYPVDGAPFTRMMAEHPPGETSNYVADVDGAPAACLQIYPVDGDACVLLVATLPEARGRGLGGRLMHRALWDARRGLRSLHAAGDQARRARVHAPRLREPRCAPDVGAAPLVPTWLVPLPRGADPPYEVWVNGVPQQEGADYTVTEGGLVFSRPLEKERIGLARWAAIFFGLFGSYGKNDSVDVRYSLHGERRLATGLDIVGPQVP